MLEFTYTINVLTRIESEGMTKLFSTVDLSLHVQENMKLIMNKSCSNVKHIRRSIIRKNIILLLFYYLKLTYRQTLRNREKKMFQDVQMIAI